MHRGVIACDPKTSFSDVATIMSDARVHCVVVNRTGPEQEQTSTWGIVSDLDLVAAFAGDARPDAGRMAASPLVTVVEDESIERAAQLMAEYSAAHLVVVDASRDRPVGVLSTLDVARLLAGQSPS
ncbi:MAG: cyclic nucleotide-binding/CBS domain-containing protein [Gaiellales bacterium]